MHILTHHNPQKKPRLENNGRNISFCKKYHRCMLLLSELLHAYFVKTVLKKYRLYIVKNKVLLNHTKFLRKGRNVLFNCSITKEFFTKLSANLYFRRNISSISKLLFIKKSTFFVSWFLLIFRNWHYLTHLAQSF